MSRFDSATASPTVAAPYPLHLGTDEAFASVRALFRRARFDEPTVAYRMGGPRLFGFPRLCDGRPSLAGPVEDANAALIRLLIDGEPLEEARTRRLCSDQGIDALLALGVLVPDETSDGATGLRATVLLAPLDGVWIACDLTLRPGETRTVMRDIVFTAHGDLTKEFLDALPDPAGQRVMELCAGTGVAALLAARHGATEAWATDIGARSTHFARFNARLSDVPGVRCEVSDVWAAAAGETFDLVVAHPPYVPSFANELEFRDAGADGEEITARIVAGLPMHVRAGGRCAMTCVITDREGEPVEARLRRWLGDAAPEFDVVVMVRREFDRLTAYRSATRGGAGWTDAERWLRHFDALGIQRFNLCAMELRRTARGRAPISARRDAGPALDAPAMDWSARWALHEATHADPAARVGSRRPRVVPGTELDLKLRSGDDGLRTIAAAVMTTYPARGLATVPALAPTLLELCDGTRDAHALLAALRTAGLVDDEVQVSHIVQVLELLLGAGALEADDLPAPRPGSTAAARRTAAGAKAVRAAASSEAQAASTATSSSPAQSTRQ